MKQIFSHSFVWAALALFGQTALAQTGIGTRSPNPSAALDIVGGSKGLLIPRVALTSLGDASTVPSPATSLLVYNTNALVVGGAGYYYNEGTPTAPAWVRLVSSGAAVGLQFWGVNGNAGTNPASNFLGTTDGQDLAFRVNNAERMRLLQGGGLFLGNAVTQNLLLGVGAAQAPLTTGTNNTLLGVNAAPALTTGGQNTALGNEAGRNLSGGFENTYVGRQAGQANVGGNKGTFVGASAGASTTGNDNTFVGYGSGLNNTIGTGNTALGLNAGSTSSNGTNNTFVGNGANSVVGSLSNATAIGAGALVGSNNTISLGNGAVRVGIGTLTGTPAQTLHVVGGARIENLGGATIGAGGDRLVVTDNNGDLSTRPIPAVVNPGNFVQNLNAGTQSGASFSIDGTGLIGSNLGVGTLSPQQRLDVNGNGTFSGSLGLGVVSPTQRLDVNGGTNISGNTTIGGTLGVSGTSNLNALNATNAALSGTLGVGGQSNLTTVRITGIGAGGGANRQVVITPAGDLATAAVPAAVNAVLNQTTQQTGANFNVDGAGTVGGLLTAGTARVVGLGGGGTRLVTTDNLGNLATQAVPAAGIFNQTTQQAGANFNISGAGTVGTLGVTNNATVGGTLGVSGATSLNTLATSGAASLNSLGVSGATNLSTLATSGAATLSSAAVTGLGGGGNRQVTVDNAGNLVAQPFPAAVNAVLNQTTQQAGASFNVSGSGQVGSLAVNTGASVGGPLGVSGATSLSTLTTSGLATVQSAAVGNLGGGGTRYVTTDNAGNLSAQPIPAAVNAVLNQTSQQAGANFNVGGTGVLGGNLTISNNNATGGGLILSDDGDIVDNNDGLATMRFTGGVQVTQGKNNNAPAIVLRPNGTARFVGLGGSGNRTVGVDNNGDLTTLPTLGGTDVIQNQNSGNQTANFRIGGTGAAASLTVDPQDANNGTYNNAAPALRFGGFGTGEAITSNRTDATPGLNRFGLDFYTGTVRRLSIGNNGNVGIGTAAPTAALHVAGTGGVRLETLGGGAGTRQVTVDNAGNLATQAIPTIPTAANFVANQTAVQGGANFNVGGTGRVGGTFTVAGTSTLAGLNAGATSVNTLSSSGAATLNSATVTTNAAVGGTLGVSGATSLNTLTTSGPATLGSAVVGNLGGGGNRQVGVDNAGNLVAQPFPAVIDAVLNQNAADQAANFRINGSGQVGSLAVNSNATLGGALGVAGAATVGGNLGVTGTLGVSGASNLAALNASGLATVQSARITSLTTAGMVVNDAAGNLTTVPVPVASDDIRNQNATDQAASFRISGSGQLGNALSVGTTLAVAGASTLNSVGVSNNATVGGNTTVGGTLGVTGTTTLGTVNAGAATLNAAAVTNNATVGGTLGVTGTATLGTLAGASNGRYVVASTTGVLSAIAAPAIPTGADFVANNATATPQTAAFNVSGTGRVGGALTVVGATTLGTVSSSGAATLNSATVTNTLGVTGATTLASTLQVNGNTTVGPVGSTTTALVVRGTGTFTNLTGTGNRVVLANASGQLTPTTFELAPGGFINNQNAVDQGADFRITGGGRVGGLLSAGANVEAGADLVAGAALGVGTFGRFGQGVGIRVNAATPLIQGLLVNGNVLPEQAANNNQLGDPNSGITTLNPAGRIWGGVNALNATLGVPQGVANSNTNAAEDRVNINGNVLPVYTAASNLGSSTLRWNNVFAANGSLSGTLGVSGASTFNTISTSGQATLQSARVTNLSGGGMVVANTSGVLSVQPIAAAVNAVLNQTTPQSGASFNVGGNGTVGTNLAVNGTSTLTDNVTLGNDLAVGGTSTLTGNVGIGLAAGTERLTVDGNVVPSVDANGGTVAGFDLGTAGAKWNRLFAFNGVIQTSDARLKTNVTNLGYGLGTVLALRPVRYAWKTNPGAANKIGFIAQELQQLVPEVVNVGTDAAHTLGVNYAELVPVLVKALQEQQQQMEAMRGRAEKAEAAVQTFEQRLRALEAGSPANATAQGRR